MLEGWTRSGRVGSSFVIIDNVCKNLMYPGNHSRFRQEAFNNLSACSAGCPSQGRFALQHAVGFPCTWRETVVQEQTSIIPSMAVLSGKAAHQAALPPFFPLIRFRIKKSKKSSKNLDNRQKSNPGSTIKSTFFDAIKISNENIMEQKWTFCTV